MQVKKLTMLMLLCASTTVLGQGRGRPVDDPGTESGRECGDRQDNDGDGISDCDDPDCATAPNCMRGGRGGRGGTDDPGTETDRECGDGQDNDGDGVSDCDDPDCATAPPCMNGGRGGRGGQTDTCTATTMAMHAATVTSTCCAGADCSAGMPTTCTPACAPVFLDFMADCGTMLTMIPGMSAQYANLQSQCDNVEVTADGTGGPTGAQDCGMNSAVRIMMGCQRIRGDFCTSPCYAALNPFVTECQAQMDPTMTMMLSSAMTQYGNCPTTGVPMTPSTPVMPTDPNAVNAECAALITADGQATLVATCLPSGDMTVMPTKCSHACADVLIPLYTQCGPMLAAAVPGIDAFAAICQTTQGH